MPFVHFGPLVLNGHSNTLSQAVLARPCVENCLVPVIGRRLPPTLMVRKSIMWHKSDS